MSFSWNKTWRNYKLHWIKRDGITSFPGIHVGLKWYGDWLGFKLRLKRPFLLMKNWVILWLKAIKSTVLMNNFWVSFKCLGNSVVMCGVRELDIRICDSWNRINLYLEIICRMWLLIGRAGFWRFGVSSNLSVPYFLSQEWIPGSQVTSRCTMVLCGETLQ